MKKLILIFLLLFPTILFAQRPEEIRVESRENQTTSWGTGTYVAYANGEALILTAYHIVRDNKDDVRINNTKATVAAIDKNLDLACLIIESPKVTTAYIGNRKPKMGDSLIACGFDSNNYKEMPGNVKAFYQNDVVSIDTSARSGDSGGGIFYADKTLAIVLFGSTKSETYGTDCMRIRQFITEKLGKYPELQKEALRKNLNYIIF